MRVVLRHLTVGHHLLSYRARSRGLRQSARVRKGLVPAAWLRMDLKEPKEVVNRGQERKDERKDVVRSRVAEENNRVPLR